MKTYKPKHNNNRTTRLIRKKRNNNLVSMIKIEMVCFCLIDIQMERMRLLFMEKYKCFVVVINANFYRKILFGHPYRYDTFFKRKN